MMKKLVIVSALLLTLSSSMFARIKTYEKDQFDASFSLGMLNWHYAFTDNYSSFPSLNFGVERAFIPINDIGIISFGGNLAFQHHSYKINNESVNWADTYLGARGLFHFTVLQIDKLDVYAGLSAGLSFYKEPITWTVHLQKSDRNVGSYQSAFVGAKYIFHPQFSVFGEADMGYDVPFLRIGISYKIQ